MNILDRTGFQEDRVESYEERAKEAQLRLEAFIRGESESFSEHFLVGTVDNVHDLFSNFFEVEPVFVADSVEKFTLESLTIWRKSLHYNDGTVCGYTYTNITPVATDGGSFSLLAATA